MAASQKRPRPVHSGLDLIQREHRTGFATGGLGGFEKSRRGDANASFRLNWLGYECREFPGAKLRLE
jgi:hypothetical protein